MDHPTPTSPLVTTQHCVHLRHKGMYVMGEPDPTAPPGFDGYGATSFWCARTQKAFGPDGGIVRRDLCGRDQGRGCCD